MRERDHETTASGTGSRRVQALFEAAFELEPDERAAYLERECADDAPLRTEIDSLFAAHDKAGEFLEEPLADAVVSIWVGRSVGKYEIVGLLGRGGMGLVFEARQENPHRTVAVKLLRPDHLDASLLRRFEFEGELLGRLQHPGIAQVFETGTFETELGQQPYLAMERVEGRDLLRYAEEERLERHERAGLLALVCDAVHHAHQRSVIHRDLKPGNVLVDAEGQPKVLDFGVARALDSDLESMTLLTRSGQLVGTLAYMSPEQASGGAVELDVRTDVYGLGVMLHELVTGNLPHEVRELSLPEAIRVIQEEPPSGIPSGDLGIIIEKALTRDRERRYGSAKDLGDDLRRFLAGEPIHARAPSALYQLQTFARRNLPLVGGVLGVALLLVVGIVITTLGGIRERRLRAEAEEARATTDRALARSEADLYLASLTAAEAALRSGDASDAQAHLEATRSELVGWEWTHLSLRLDRSEELWRHRGGVNSIAVSPDGRHVATGGGDGRVRLWERETGTLVWERRVSTLFGVRGMTFSPDGDRIAVGSGSWVGRRAVSNAGTRSELETQGPFTILKTSDGKPIGEPFEGHRDAVQDFAFHPRRPLLFSASSDSTVRVWDTTTHAEIAVLEGHENQVRELVISPDGTELASVAWDSTVHLHDADTFELLEILRADVPVLNALAWSPDGATIAVGTRTGDVMLMDRANGGLLRGLTGHGSRITALAFTPDGTRLVSSSLDHTLRSWDPRTGRELGLFLGAGASVLDFCFEPGGATLLSGDTGGFVRRWAVATEDVRTLSGYGNIVYSVDVSPDGRLLASGSAGISHGQPFPETGGRSFVRITELASGRLQRTLFGHGRTNIWSVRFSPDSRRLTSVGDAGLVIVWDVASGERIHELDHPRPARRAAFDSRGERIVTTSLDESVRLWDASTGELLHELSAPGRIPYFAAFDPGGRWLIVTYRGGAIGRWDLEALALDRMVEDVHQGTAYMAVFDPRGGEFVTAGEDQRVQRWDAERFVPLGERLVHSALIGGLAYSPDGRRLAAADHDVLRLWDTETWEAVANLRGHAERQTTATFSPDGRYLVTSGSDRTVRIWDGGTEARRLVDRWMGELLLADDVVERVRAATDLDETVRSEALEIATAQLRSADELVDLAWQVVRTPDRTDEEYALALRRARAAVLRKSDGAAFRSTLGAALFRTGATDEALEVLRPSDAAPGASPAAVAFLALTFLERGERRAAEREHARLTQLLADDRWTKDAAVIALGEELITVLAEENP